MEGFIDSSLLIPDRFSKVLRSDSNGRPDHAEPARDLVEEFERPVVDVCLLEFKVVLQAAGQQMRHCFSCLVVSLLPGFLTSKSCVHQYKDGWKLCT